MSSATDRWKNHVDVQFMSMYNEDVLCMKCKEAEAKREDYDHAREVEKAHVCAGDRNFKGIGWS